MNSRAKLVSLIALATLSTSFFSGCTGSSYTTLPSPTPSPFFFLDTRSTEVDMDYVDRYACPTGVPLKCQCTSMRIARTCDCQC